MPKVKNNQYSVIKDLENLSIEFDEVSDRLFPELHVFAEFYEMYKEAARQIRDCSDLKEVVYPPSILSFLAMKEKEMAIESIPKAEADGDQRMAEIQKTVVQDKESHGLLVENKRKTEESLNTPVGNNKKMTEIQKTIVKDKGSHRLLLDNQLKIQTSQNINEAEPNSDQRMAENGKTVVKVRKSPKLLVENHLKIHEGQNTNEAEPNSDQRMAENGKTVVKVRKSPRLLVENHLKIHESQKVPSKNVDNDQRILETPKTEEKGKRSYTVAAKSQPKTKENQNIPKSVSDQKMAEIRKTDNKSTRSLRVLVELPQLKAKGSQKKNEKMETQMQKRLVCEKEKQRLEKEKEILKKKIDVQKSKSKTFKENLAKPPLITRSKETNEGKRTLQETNEGKKTKDGNECKKPKVANESNEQLVLKNSTAAINPVKQNSSSADAVFKTPNNKISMPNNNYDLTPAPDSSTYDFSDDDDEQPSGKPIPPWASGVQLKNNLIQQFYNPVDTDLIFGCCLNEAPDLAAIFNVQKKAYFKRTSSAVWDHIIPDDRPF